MYALTVNEVEQVSGSLKAVDVLHFGEAMAAGAMGAIVGVVTSPFLTPAGGVMVGWAAGVAIDQGFSEINSLIGLN